MSARATKSQSRGDPRRNLTAGAKPSFPPALDQTSPGWLFRIMGQGNQVFVFGEIHGDKGNVDYMKGALTSLRERGVKNFAIELPEDAQDAFSSRVGGAAKGGVGGSNISAENGAQLSGVGDYLILASHARKLGMEVHCVDAPRCPEGSEVQKIAEADSKYNNGIIGEERYVKDVQGQFARRNEHMAEKVSKIQGDTVLLTGMFHTGGPGSVEERLRKKGAEVVSVDLYPQGANPTVSLFERNESPSVDIKVKDTQRSPSQTDINAMIGKLRGVRGGREESEAPSSFGDDSPVEIRRAIPLRRGGVSFAPSAQKANTIGG